MYQRVYYVKYFRMVSMQILKNELTDEAMCVLAASGDRIAEEAIVMRYNRLVRICARPFFLAGGDSEDLIQEGMVGLLTAIREFNPAKQVAFRTFAETCIRNRIISAIKTASRDKHTPLNSYISFEPSLFDGKTDRYLFGASDPRQKNPEDVLIHREALQERMDALNGQLSGFEARILGLYLSGLSYSEIAQEVERPLKSVDNAVQRIRRKVAQHIQSGELSES